MWRGHTRRSTPRAAQQRRHRWRPGGVPAAAPHSAEGHSPANNHVWVKLPSSEALSRIVIDNRNARSLKCCLHDVRGRNCATFHKQGNEGIHSSVFTPWNTMQPVKMNSPDRWVGTCVREP